MVLEYLRQEMFPCSVPLCTKISTSRKELEKHFLKSHGEKKTEVWTEFVEVEFNFENLAESDQDCALIKESHERVLESKSNEKVLSPKSKEKVLSPKSKEKVLTPKSNKKVLTLKSNEKVPAPKSDEKVISVKSAQKAVYVESFKPNSIKVKKTLKQDWLLKNESDFTIKKIENLTKIKLTEEAKADFDDLIQKGKDQEIYCKLFGNIFRASDPLYTVQYRNWICKTCPNEKFLGSKQEFEVHFEALHHGIITFTCELCSKSQRSFERLKSHLKIKHFTDAKCEICSDIFPTNETLQMHKLKVHEQGGYQCDSCIKMCSTLLRLKAHIKEFHGDASFPCSTCGKVFKTKGCCAQHELIHSGKEFECDFCIDKFKSEAGFNRHVKFKHTLNFENSTCHECGAVFKEKTRFNNHMKFHQKHQDLICDVCDKLFHSRKAKVLHKETVHLKNKKFACNQCEFRTVANAKLKRHIQKVHDNQHELCFLCNISVKHAYHHVRTAHKDKPSAWQEFMDRKKEALTLLKSKQVKQEVFETTGREQKADISEGESFNLDVLRDDQEVLPSDEDIVC